MKRGKDEEKMMEPMFPRLHVNDADKGGPRAPPRNKMALYEQLTIPSQRYNSGAVPPKQNNNNYNNNNNNNNSNNNNNNSSNSNNNLAASTSTNQGSSRERTTHFPLYQPSSAPAYDNSHFLNTEPINLNNQPVHVESKKRPLEDDDFMVPVFSEMHHDKNQNSTNGEGHFHLSSNNQGILPTTIGEKTIESYNSHLGSKQLIEDQHDRTSRGSPSRRSSVDISRSGRDDLPWQRDASLLREHEGTHRMSSAENTGVCLNEDVPDLQVENPCRDTSLRMRLNPQTGHGYGGDNEINNEIDRIDGNQSIDRGDDVSETSMVDSPSELDITPDDVVDVIGRKHFWKARTAIVNQQRVFAVQVFELHRLLKVQKLIAGSPNLLLESSAFVGKSSLKRSTVDNYSSDYVVEPLPHKSSQKDKVEGTAENVVSKTSAPTPPQQHPIQPVGNPSVSSMDPKMNPWAFYQPSAHQWLVPVMTPSEGLVYKPFPAPGFMGPVCGGCGPVGPTSQYHQQGMGMPPGIHYFPPYDGMPMMGPSPTMSGSTVDQLSPFLGSNPYSQTSQPERPRARKQREVQGSTGSSPCERSQGIRMGPLPDGREGRNPPFVPPPTTEVPNDTPPREKQARVIRAVPHRSTSDSAARIFQSIQQERQRSGSS